MSGLRDNLEDWALAHGEQVAAVMTTHEAAGRRAIRSRRRNRILATGATAAAAVVGVVTLASAVPGVNQQPAAQDLARHLSELVCGDPWVVSAGNTEYYPEADFYFDEPRGDWVLTDDDGDTHTGYSGFTAGLGSVSWQGAIDVRGHTIVRARTVAVKLGTIVGVTEEQYGRVRDEGGASIYANAPRPGACGDTSPGNSSGKVTYHLVLQLTRVGDGGGPVATIVDPGGAKTVDIDGVEAYIEAQAAPSVDPLAPRGDLYQAFAVPAPTSTSCTPFQDMIDAGEPLVFNHMQYLVTIPGVQPITGATWANEPAAIVDDPNYHAWYTDLPAAIVAEHFKGGNPLGYLTWTAGPNVSGEAHPDQLRLVNTDEATFPMPATADCVFTLPLPAVSGAVYLVIDGVDASALDDAYPGADYDLTNMQTWVYLGQAD